MKIGMCGCMIYPEKDPIGIEVVEETARLGYDYIELALRDVAALDAAGFSALSRRLQKSGLRSEACNNFYPASQRITGPDFNLQTLRGYTAEALRRAKELGAEFVVFGSSIARNIPDGFPRDTAWAQIVDASRMIAEEAEKTGVTVAIEYHNKNEANVLLSMAEAMKLFREIDRKRIQVLADYYHYAVQEESPSDITRAAGHIVHAHFAELRDRAFPLEPKQEYRDFIGALKAGGYTGRISIEAFTKNFSADAPKALAVMRELVKD
ncbi:MAG: sugar phosphate isomerase/epimerase [Spirochaetales bacterium]|jgi:sugar phosphate isomerase/epimerase|nr:sugar phosphate isomerase/epimerase [Spirochaetales bacterium]